MNRRLRNKIVFSVSVAVAAAALMLPHPMEAQRSIGFERDRMKTILGIVSKQVEKNFYDPEMKGLNWPELVAETRAKIEAANSVSAMVTPIFAMIDKLQDSHTIFAPPERGATAEFGFKAKAFGEQIRIYEMDEKGAAAAAGLQLGDELLELNGYPAERGSWDLMTLFFRILNPISAMQITYSREESGPQQVIVKAKVKQGALVNDLTQDSNIYELIREGENEWAKVEDKIYAGTDKNGIGHIGLPMFSLSDRTLNLMSDEIKKARAVIIDLRDNPGGAVSALKRFAGYFEPQDTVIGDEVGRDKTEPMKISARGPKLTGPLFILVDSQSASAAELFTRHFQRSGRATVIGDQTSGRVTVARYYRFSAGTDTVVPYGVQVAVARIVFPDGEELEKRGVTPDHACLPTEEDLREDLDPCMAMAEELAREAVGAAAEANENQ